MRIQPWLKERPHQLRSLGWTPRKSALSIAEYNRRVLIRLCPNFMRRSLAGVCSEKEVVCTPCFCGLLRSCGQDCLSVCLANDPSASELSDFPTMATLGLSILDKSLRSILADNDQEQLIGELTLTLEKATIKSLSFWPGDLPTIVAIREWMRQVSLLTPTTTIPESTDLAEQIWEIFVFKGSLDFLRNLVTASDAKILVRRDQHQKFVDLLQHDPVVFMETFFFPLLEPDFGQHRSSHFAETLNMLSVKEWCAANELEYAVHLYNHVDLQELVLANKSQMEEIGSTDITTRFEASYPLFRSVFDTCRSLYFSSSFFKDVVNRYTELSCQVTGELKEMISPYFWDEVVWQLSDLAGLRKIEKYLSNLAYVDNVAGWPVHLKGDPLIGSGILFALTSTFYKDITAGNEYVGSWFEDLVERELRIRRIPVIERNLPLPTFPSGEIDFVCYDDRAVFIIEAKDYGPRSRKGYFSSKEYRQRLDELESYLDRFYERLCWFKSNRNQYNLPSHIPVRGICITSHKELHIEKVDPEIQLVSLKELSDIFSGAPVQPKVFRGKYSLLDALEFRREHPETRLGDGWEEETEESVFIKQTIEEKFGSYEAFKLYKYTSEMLNARRQAEGRNMIGVGVGELIATHERYLGSSFNFWDVLYVTYHLELFEWNNLLREWQRLIDDTLIEVDKNGYIVDLEDIPPAHYRKSENQWVTVPSREEADIVLYIQNFREEGNFCVGGFIDALVRKEGEFQLIEQKVF